MTSKPHTRPATEQQRSALVKLRRLLGEPAGRDHDLDAEAAAELIASLSRRYNELEPAERSRRARELSERSTPPAKSHNRSSIR
jgi:hypothetical protein